MDEVGEIPLEVQGKLLRVLQEGCYERVGDDRTRTVDVRIVAATNRDLRAEVEAGRFREDLYYQLNVFPIEVAPLRRRSADIPRLAAHFVQISAARLNRPTPRLTERNLDDLTRYAWPGNVRELQNLIERAMILSRSGALEFDLPATGDALSSQPSEPELAERVLTEKEIRQLERDNIVHALEQAGWQVSGTNGAAALLGVNRSTLASRMRTLGIRKPAPPSSFRDS